MNSIQRTLLMLMLALILIGSLVTKGCLVSWNTSQIPDIGSLAPDFQLDNLDGQSVSLSGYRGQPVLVNFWATWCQPCRSEMPLIQMVFTDKKWADEGLMVLAIEIGESPARVKEFVKEYEFTFPILLDSSQNVFFEYHAHMVPTTFFIDRLGRIREIKIGPFSSVEEIETSLEKIIG